MRVQPRQGARQSAPKGRRMRRCLVAAAVLVAAFPAPHADAWTKRSIRRVVAAGLFPGATHLVVRRRAAAHPRRPGPPRRRAPRREGGPGADPARRSRDAAGARPRVRARRSACATSPPTSRAACAEPASRRRPGPARWSSPARSACTTTTRPAAMPRSASRARPPGAATAPTRPGRCSRSRAGSSASPASTSATSPSRPVARRRAAGAGARRRRDRRALRLGRRVARRGWLRLLGARRERRGRRLLAGRPHDARHGPRDAAARARRACQGERRRRRAVRPAREEDAQSPRRSRRPGAGWRLVHPRRRAGRHARPPRRALVEPARSCSLGAPAERRAVHCAA